MKIEPNRTDDAKVGGDEDEQQDDQGDGATDRLTANDVLFGGVTEVVANRRLAGDGRLEAILTAAPDEDPAPPRHCQEDMDLVAPSFE